MVYLPVKFSVTKAYSPLKLKKEGAQHYEKDQEKVGSLPCTLNAATSINSTPNLGKEEWISFQRDSLVKIFHQMEKEAELKAAEVACSSEYLTQSTLFSPQLYSLKTAPQLGKGDVLSLSGTLWRGGTPGETVPLKPLMSAGLIAEIDGGVLLQTVGDLNFLKKKEWFSEASGFKADRRNLLPTLTKGFYNTVATKGKTIISENGNFSTRREDGGTSTIGTGAALRALLSISTEDYEQLSMEEIYQKLTDYQFKHVPTILQPTPGRPLTPAFAEWYMGYPIGMTALQHVGTDKSHE